MIGKAENAEAGRPALLRRGYWFAVAACWLLAGLWITDRSFWLDEGMAISKSVQPTLEGFWALFSGTRASDLQQPLFMLLSWAWEKVAGPSEWGMRAANWLWMALATGYVATRPWLGRRTRLLWCVLAALSPFVAMYMDEGKGYILHFAGGTMMFLPLAGGSGKRVEDFEFGAFSVGLLLTCGAALTGVVYAFWAGLWLLARIVRQGAAKRFLAARAGWALFDAAVLAALGGWYVHTLLVGARGTMLGPPTPATMAFFAYEWLGFSGAGPARLVMRVAGPRALLPHALPLALYAAATGFFALECLRVAVPCFRPGGSRGAWRLPACAVPLAAGLAGLLSMLVVGVVDDMAVRARHAMPVFPAALLVAAVCADRLLASGRKTARAAPVLLLVAMLASSLSLRFGERHGKEDYRRAAALAREELQAGRCVWWAADANTASLYGLADVPADRFVHAIGVHLDYAAQPPPDAVFVNRPDTWDMGGTLARHLAESGLCEAESFTGFKVYRRAGQSGSGDGGER